MSTFHLHQADDTVEDTTDDGSDGSDTTDNSGDDSFDVDSSTTGTVDGGDGDDTVYADGSLGSAAYENVETLSIGWKTSATIDQLNAFTTITTSSDSGVDYIKLTGTGGTIDFSSLIAEGESLKVDGKSLTDTAEVTGTDNDDSFSGFHHSDTLNGGGGDDTFTLGREDNPNGSIDGGDGYDTVQAISQSLGTIDFSNVEELTGSNITAHIDQLDAFDTIAVGYGINLIGEGGTLDLTDKVGDDGQGNINASALTSAIDLTGSAYDDKLIGSAYDDTINGGDGNDSIRGGGGYDTIDGGAGNDVLDIRGSSGDFSGGDDNDTFYVSSTTSGTVDGGDGTDTVYARSYFTGGGHLGTASYSDVEVLDADAVTGTIKQLNAFSSITYSGNWSQKIGITLTGAGGSLDLSSKITGWDSAVVNASATTSAVAIAGTAHNDTITGSAYDDLLKGGDGADTIIGGQGNDKIYGGNGGDVLYGGDGSDTIHGGGGGDFLSGGGGNDVLWVEGHNNIAYGDNGNDLFISYGGNIINGGAGTDIVVSAIGSVKVDLTAHTITYVDAGNLVDHFVNIEGVATLNNATIEVVGGTNQTVNGSSGNDNMDAGDNGQSLDGGAGNDHLSGGNGNDTLDGGTGSDTINAGNGNDTVDGGSGADNLNGGSGEDTLTYADSTTGITISLFTGKASGGDATGDVFKGFEDLIGSALADNLAGDGNSNDLSGGGGNDTLNGGNGNDTLTGGSGADTLTGGSGKDVFDFTVITDSTRASHDTITDFAHGLDKIDLSAIDANSLVSGNQSFSFIGSAGFDGHAGEVRYAGGHIYADVNGDKIADLDIVMLNNAKISAGDFVL